MNRPTFENPMIMYGAKIVDISDNGIDTIEELKQAALEGKGKAFLSIAKELFLDITDSREERK